jgi:hypothetical protein
LYGYLLRKVKMVQIIINENQLNLIKGELIKQSEISLAEEKWNNFTNEEKQFVVELLRVAYPEKSKLIKEHWLNTVGDIVGIFDPTGVVDLVNGISYITQEEYLFGFLSIVSAIPYAGDFVAKPVMAALKLGKPSAKALNGIMKTAKAGNVTKASADLAKLSQSGGITGAFVKGFQLVGPKVKSIVERIPGGMATSGLKNTILGWIDLFSKAGSRAIKTQRDIGRLSRRLPKMTPAVAAKKLEDLSSAIKSSPGVFTGYRTTKGLLSWKTIFGGMPQLMGRNKSVRALMRQSKWWLGFLDYIGLGNFVGPEELSKQLGGEEAMRQKMEEYNKTPDAERNFKDEYGKENDGSSNTNTTSSSSASSASPKMELDPFAKFLRGIITGGLNPIPGM